MNISSLQFINYFYLLSEYFSVYGYIVFLNPSSEELMIFAKLRNINGYELNGVTLSLQNKVEKYTNVNNKLVSLMKILLNLNRKLIWSRRSTNTP